MPSRLWTSYRERQFIARMGMFAIGSISGQAAIMLMDSGQKLPTIAFLIASGAIGTLAACMME